VALVVLIVVVLVAAVGSYRISGRASVKTTDGGLKVMVGARTGAAMQAGIHSKVTKVGKCIGLAGDLTIWPHGTEVLSGNRIRVGEESYGLGDTFDGGGGVLEQNSHDFDPSSVDAHAGCPVTDALIVLAPPE
jgi:hypothetical protein